MITYMFGSDTGNAVWMCLWLLCHRWWQLLCPAVPQLCCVCGREQSHTSHASIKKCEENNDTFYLEVDQELNLPT